MSPRRAPLLVAVALVVGACGRESVAPCLLGVAGEVRSGPSAGLDLSGALKVLVVDGVVQGSLDLDEGGEAEVTGSFSGEDVALSLELDANRRVTAAGIVSGSLVDCFGDVAGALSGPEQGDEGTFRAVAVGLVADDDA